MKIQRNKIEKELVSKELEESQIQKVEKMDQPNRTIVTKSNKQSAERKLTSDLLSIKDQMQDYVDKDPVEKEMRIIDFVKLYLRLLNITQRDLASVFEMKDTHLFK